ncbi:MAG: C4-dicarboxylate ABC transporter permease, partial [Pseudomonadota bacterium]
NDARRTYRRAGDNAYQPITELIAILDDAAALEAFLPELLALQGEIGGLTDDRDAMDAMMERIKEVEASVGRIEGTSEIKKALSKARRGLRGRRGTPEKAVEEMAKAVAAFEEDIVWRQEAASRLKPGLVEYQAAIAETIGLRSQPRLPREQALYVAACRADHRDISLNF